MYIPVLKKNINISPAQTLVAGFIIVILAGTMLLTLPAANIEGVSAGFVNALFTATSAVCVTGMAVVDTGTYWSPVGQTIIMILVQIGGLGIMTFSTLFALLIGRKITLRERLLLQESLNQFELKGMVRLAKRIVIATFCFEAVGAFVYTFVFIPQFGWVKGAYMSIFHSVASLNHAGFDLMGAYSGPFSSLTGYVSNPLININAIFLIVVGGLGFSVWIDLYDAVAQRSFRRLTLHTKVVLVMNAGLILFGAIFIFIMEFNNPGTLKNLPLHGKILASFFHSVTPRSSGFNTLDMTALTMPTMFLTMIFMFIGGSPGSTAGGIKTTTAGILFFTILSVVKGKENTELFRKTLSRGLVYRAVAIAIVSFMIVVAATMLLSIVEAPHNNPDFETLVFEATSAFGIVGLTMDYTHRLTPAGKTIVTLCMFMGRVGPLSLVFALTLSANRNKAAIKYPEDRIIVG